GRRARRHAGRAARHVEEQVPVELHPRPQAARRVPAARRRRPGLGAGMSADHDDDRDEAALIEEVAGSFRPRDPRTLAALPAWHDLSPDGREEAYRLSVELRALEAALDPHAP